MHKRPVSLIPILCLAGTVSAGCLPMVTHGPQVENAVSGGLTAGLHAGPKYDMGDWVDWPAVVPSIGLNLNRGWRAEQPDEGAFQISVHVPALAVAAFPAGLLVTQADGYYQFPAKWTKDLDAGAGINLSWFHAMPYAQLGKISPEGNGWYTTQGFGAFAEDDSNGYELWAVAWVPTVAYQTTKGNRTIHYFLTGSVLREPEKCSFGICDGPDVRYLVAAGITLQFTKRR